MSKSASLWPLLSLAAIAALACGSSQAQTPEPAQPTPLAVPLAAPIPAPATQGPSATGPALTLDQAIARALAANPQIATAEHNIRAAQNSLAANNVQRGLTVTGAASGSATTYKTTSVAGAAQTGGLGLSGFSEPTIVDSSAAALFTSSGITTVSTSSGSGSSTLGSTATTTIVPVTGSVGSSSSSSSSSGSPTVSGAGSGNAGTASPQAVVTHTSQVSALVNRLQQTTMAAAGQSNATASTSSGNSVSAIYNLISSSGSYENYAASITASNPIDVFNIVGQASSVLKLNADFYIADRTRTANELALSVKNAYFAALQYQSNIATAQEQVDEAQITLRDATVKYDAGAAAQYDVYAAQSQLYNAQETLIAARNNLAVQMQSLNTLMGAPPASSFSLVQPALPALPPQFDVAGAVSRAMTSRPEMQEANLGIEMARRVTRIQQAGSLPSVGLGASVNYTGAYPGSDGKHYNAALLATISVPIDDAGKTRVNVKIARENETEEATIKQQLAQNIELEVRNGTVNVITAQALVASALANVTYNRELTRIAEIRYRAGAGTLLELTTAQANLAGAENSLAAAQYQLQTSYASFLRATGGR